jgi:hypothetical protein
MSRAAASRASRCAAVSQTWMPTRLPVGTSLWQVTFPSAFGAFESADCAVVEPSAGTEVAAVEVTVALGACDPPALATGAFVAGATIDGAFSVNPCPAGAEAQPHTRTLGSRMRIAVPEARVSGMRLLGQVCSRVTAG